MLRPESELTEAQIKLQRDIYGTPKLIPKKMEKDYEVDWEASHSTVVKANSREEAIEIVKDLADREQSFIKIVDGPFVNKL